MADEQKEYNNDYANEQQYDYSDTNCNNEGQEQDGDLVDGTNGEEEERSGNTIDGDHYQSKSQCEEERKLFIGGISWDTESKDLKEYFSKFGEIIDVNIKTDPNTGKSRGFGFVTFTNQEAVETVLKTSSHAIKGKQVDPKRAKARPGIKKIFVGGLEADFPEADIRAYFEKYGKIENIELPFDKVKNQRRQFCFITFEAENAVEEVCKQPKQKIGNKECDIKKATPKPDPRFMRGGWGFAWGIPRSGIMGRGRGRGGRGGYQNQGWANQAYGYNQGYGNYNQGGYGGYGNYNYDYNYGTSYSGYNGGYDYGGWNYGQGGYGGGYGDRQQKNDKTRQASLVGQVPRPCVC
ncbi:heterogeneous nuclear ribonucleoprotein D-like isoform X1 [Centruroides vittatus]|uniref:heterogeneous nuclear ribonucleoprotein D-like isoform X1 n=1 Tax=Centruroides vittatus TaxID=120091 RepID=UPI003510A1E6